MILFAIFRNLDRVDFFLHTSKFEKMGDFESKSKEIWLYTKKITSIVIYFEIYYTGSFSKYSHKMLGLLPVYLFHYNSSNLKKIRNFL